MKPYLQDPDVTLYHGDALDVLRSLPNESVHCIAPSPPFYALRDYGTGRWEGGDLEHEHDRVGARGGRGGSGTLDKRSGDAMPATLPAGTCSCGAVYRDPQIGLEETPDAWAAVLVAVFREARRVLRKDGTLWVECGDSYATGPVGGTAGQWNGSSPLGGNRNAQATVEGRNKTKRPEGLKPKDLLGTPWLLAFALRADGWWLRGCNIWAKPNAMPESAKDRCTTAHSYVFHFAKSGKPTYWTNPHRGTLVDKKPTPDYWWFDPERITAPSETEVEGWDRRNVWQGHDYFFDGDAISTPLAESTLERSYTASKRDRGMAPKNGAEPMAKNLGSFVQPSTTHPRSVWTIPTQGYPEAHFATWPEALARRIILAGCPEAVCSVCGEARVRVVERDPTPVEAFSPDQPSARVRNLGKTSRLTVPGAREHLVPQPRTVGFTDCGHNAYQPGVILDPFVGSGTTCFVARKLGRRSIGIDLNPEYLKLAAKRLQQQSLFA